MTAIRVGYGLALLFWIDSLGFESGSRKIPAPIDVSTAGFMTAKANPASSEVHGSMMDLNHHAAYYFDIIPTLAVSPEAELRTKLNLQSTSLTDERYPKQTWSLTGHLEKSLVGGGIYASLDAGNLDNQTLGKGLTFRNMNTVGIFTHARIGSAAIQGGIWAQDYDVPGDVIIAGVSLPNLEIGLNAVLWYFDQSGDTKAVYFLPYCSIPVGFTRFFGETGVKATKDEDLSRNNIGRYPDATFAGLLGVESDFIWLGWKFRMSTSGRYYGKNFIPLTGVDEDRYTSLFNYDKPADNWIDFFSSVGPTTWFYGNVSVESPKWRGFSIFANEEWLVCATAQSHIFDEVSGSIISFKPSLNLYRIGARYAPGGLVNLDLLLSNRLLNPDPEVNRPPESDAPLHQYGKNLKRQFHSRFYAAEPFFECRLLWGFNGI